MNAASSTTNTRTAMFHLSSSKKKSFDLVQHCLNYIGKSSFKQELSSHSAIFRMEESLQLCCSFGQARYLCNANAKIFVNDNDLALGQEFAIDLDIYRLTSQFIQFNN